VTVEYCDIGPDGFQPGSGNIQVDPLWTADFHLSGVSPCRNSGSPASTGLPSTDYDGNPRVAGGRVDMGAFEFRE
jgi:hypothetical protein